jgi:hypothetical protein
VAARTNGEFPVIARHDDAYDCDKIGNMSAGDSNDILYVFTYSETSRSLCFVTYQRARESATQSRSEVLSSNSGQNYGRQLSTPIAAVPGGHLSIKFPESYLTLLHWRRPVDAALLARAGNAQLRFCVCFFWRLWVWFSTGAFARNAPVVAWCSALHLHP